MTDLSILSRRLDRIGKGSRRWLAVAVIMPMLMASGCANLSLPLTHRKASCPDDGVGCLPVDGSVVPPAASVHVAHRCVDPLPDDAIPAPVGTYVGQWRGAMSHGAQERHWFVSRDEWFDGGSQLGPKGKRHVERIAKCLFNEPQPVVIENEPVALEMGESYEEAVQSNQQLQVERRSVVVTALAEAGVPDANQWVVFADDRNVGVRGIEAPQVFNQQFMGGLGGGRGNRGGIGRGQGGMGMGMGGMGMGMGGMGMGGMGMGGFGGGGIF